MNIFSINGVDAITKAKFDRFPACNLNFLPDSSGRKYVIVVFPFDLLKNVEFLGKMENDNSINKEIIQKMKLKIKIKNVKDNSLLCLSEETDFKSIVDES